MRTVRDVRAHCDFLLEKGAGDQPAELFLPKQEALRRKVNKEKHHRIVFEVTPEEYSDWHEMKERYFSLMPNKTVALHIMVTILKAISNESIEAMYRDEQQEDSLETA